MKIFNKCHLFKFLMVLLVSIVLAVLTYLRKSICIYAAGHILNTELNLMLSVFSIMLIVVLPVLVLIFCISYYYRESNKKSNYIPNWSHSYALEFICWCIPIVIIIFLANLSWKTTHALEPSKSLQVNAHKPITIEVVSLNWRWLFIYPYYKIATINELSFPKNVPIHFHITSQSVMNSFFIPNLGSQIYTMAGMKTELNLIALHRGKYKGFSSNYSGRGFSNMKFQVNVQKNMSDFNHWVKMIQLKKNTLFLKNQFLSISKDNEKDDIQYFSYVDSFLLNKIINTFTIPHNI
ncbi:ubiquinol oxidase subunit II [Buchnera aphidicola]|uniref:ubiquinol oxidase subunit II n=1 Tax=Buchnera aphidicola TaxID=9 RepID=UPI00094C00FE|nr:ubiquinol oxidase subunit II [Buchnera aphidicola]